MNKIRQKHLPSGVFNLGKVGLEESNTDLKKKKKEEKKEKWHRERLGAATGTSTLKDRMQWYD